MYSVKVTLNIRPQMMEWKNQGITKVGTIPPEGNMNIISKWILDSVNSRINAEGIILVK